MIANSSTPQLFSNSSFGSVRVIERDGEPWFVAGDVAKALGYEAPSRAVLQHCKKANKITQIGDSPVTVHQPPVNILIIPESDVYRLVMRSHLPTAERFQDWVVEEILPAIRRTGSYGDSPESLMARAVLVAQETLKRLEAKTQDLEEKVERDRPKVAFADAIEVSEDTILVGELAKLIKQGTGIDMGQKRLFDWLRVRGYLHKTGSDRNMPTQRSMEQGLFVIKEGARIGSSGESHITKTSKVTSKGQIYFVNLFKKEECAGNMSPIVNMYSHSTAETWV